MALNVFHYEVPFCDVIIARMSDDKPHASFWTTLPGILTGVASVLTALVAVVTLMNQPKESETAAGAPQALKIQNLGKCGEFVGKWDWFIGGELRAEKNGYVDWRKNASDPQPVITGQWLCVDSRPKKVNISWQNGVSETLTFSPDKRSLSGVNSINVQVSGTKKK
jgi:hypothetical protein